MHIGLIGGFGPVATMDYYHGLVAAAEAEKRPLRLSISHGDMWLAFENLTAGRRMEQAEILVQHVAELERAGAEVFSITSLSLHSLLPEIANRAAIPACSLLDALTEQAAASGLRRVGVIGSSVAMADSVLGAYLAIEAIVFDDNLELLAVNDAYFRMAQTRRCLPEQRSLFDQAAEKLIRKGAEAILLGGTDFSLAYGVSPPNFPAIDPVKAHVDSLRKYI